MLQLLAALFTVLAKLFFAEGLVGW
jgi:hypothetical protein